MHMGLESLESDFKCNSFDAKTHQLYAGIRKYNGITTPLEALYSSTILIFFILDKDVNIL